MVSNGITIWDAPVSALYELDWLQCKQCKRWHQLSQEFLDLVDQKHPGETGVIIADPEGTTGAGSTCLDCGGMMGRWIPENAIGSRPDGSYILRGDPEDPGRRQTEIALAKHRARSRLRIAHIAEYVKLYEEEMRNLGYERIPPGERQTNGHRVAGGWRRIADTT